VTPDQKFVASLPGVRIPIRQNPGPGEYRYVQFTWKKKGGERICLQIGNDGKFGPQVGVPGKFRYDAGAAAEEAFGAAVRVDAALPGEFVLVTRDLYADFGEFTLTGLSLAPIDGEYAAFDHIYVGKRRVDFDLVK
jgi:biopolymer transport protein ExbB